MTNLRFLKIHFGQKCLEFNLQKVTYNMPLRKCRKLNVSNVMCKLAFCAIWRRLLLLIIC